MAVQALREAAGRPDERALGRVEVVAVVTEPATVCPWCGYSAANWRELHQRFHALMRPEPHDGLVWPQLWRCCACGFVFGQPWEREAMMEGEVSR